MTTVKSLLERKIEEYYVVWLLLCWLVFWMLLLSGLRL